MKKLFLQVFITITCASWVYIYGQVPFDCNGKSYRVLARDNGTYLQEIIQNKSDQTISFLDLHFFPDQEINSIAYHPSQNVIYGIMQTPPYRLCRIDAEFNLDILQTLPLSTDLVFVSGDISPDEQYLVLFGFGNTRNENIFALVDVQDGTYETEIIPIRANNPDEPYIYCADIAFHPTNGKLFGFDFRHDRLVTLDIANRIIDNMEYPVSRAVSGNMPSIFFNSSGELFGIGATTQDSSHHRAYYQFDLATGQGITLEELTVEKNQDACSCPYRINVLNEVSQRDNAPCTELAFEMTIINRTDTEQFDLVLKDSFPEYVNIKSISPLPFEGSIEKSIGNNLLTISNIYLPIGTFTFEVVLNIDEGVKFGEYHNQAVLSGISIDDFELNEVLSDDPITAVANDATLFSINDLVAPFADDFFGICDGGEVTLQTGIQGANSYAWSSGETTESITVYAEGTYQVTITTACDQTVGTAMVVSDEISLALGEERQVQSGQSVILEADVQSQSLIKSFNWQSTGAQELDCPTCEKPMVQPEADTEVQLVVENGSGCLASDELNIIVADIKIFIPNIFRPNGDDSNKRFFLQGNLKYDIAQFQIYDRWGSILFDQKNFKTNDGQMGWDGTYAGTQLSPGIYIWKAVIRHKNGEEQILSGDVTLAR